MTIGYRSKIHSPLEANPNKYRTGVLSPLDANPVKYRSNCHSPLEWVYPEPTNIYISLSANDYVTVYSTQGVHQFTWEVGAGANPTQIDVYKDEVFVACTYDQVIKVYSLTGTYKRTIGSYGPDDGQFMYPFSVFCYNNEVFVGDSGGVGGGRIQVFTLSGTFIRKWATGVWPNIAAYLNVYKDEVYLLSDITVPLIRVYSLEGSLLRSWGAITYNPSDPDPAKFYNQGGAIFLYKDIVYASALYDVKLFTKDGTFISRFTPTSGGYLKGLSVYNDKIYLSHSQHSKYTVHTLTGTLLSEFNCGTEPMGNAFIYETP